MATPAEMVQLVAQAMQPVLTELNRQGEERMTRIVGDATEQIRRLEQQLTELRAQQPPRNNGVRGMMDAKAFAKIGAFKDGAGKWRSFRTQVENLAESAYPGFGRRTLRWARGLGYQEFTYTKATIDSTISLQSRVLMSKPIRYHKICQPPYRTT